MEADGELQGHGSCCYLKKGGRERDSEKQNGKGKKREGEGDGRASDLLVGCWSRQRLGAEEEHGEVETEAGSGRGGAHGVGLGVLQVRQGWRP